MIFILKSHEMTGLKNSKKNVTLKKNCSIVHPTLPFYPKNTV